MKKKKGKYDRSNTTKEQFHADITRLKLTLCIVYFLLYLEK